MKIFCSKYKYKKFILLLLIVITSLYIFSCSSDTVQYIENITDAEKVINKINLNSSSLNSFYAEGEITIDSPDLSASGSITLYIINSDSIYFKIEGPFGIDIAHILFDRERFQYYDVQKNTLYKGRTLPENLRILIKISMDFDEISNMFTGSYKIHNSTNDSIFLKESTNIYELTIINNSEKNKYKYIINKNNFLVLRCSKYDISGKELYEIDLSDFEKKGIFTIPTVTNFQNKITGEKIWLYYNNTLTNPSRMDFKIKYPKSIKIIEWN